MRNVFTKMLMVVAVTILFQACGSSALAQRPEEVLIGKWELDAKKSVERGGDQMRQILSEFHDMSLDFHKDGTGTLITVMAHLGRTTITDPIVWKVNEFDGKTYELKLSKVSWTVTRLGAGDFIQLKERTKHPIKTLLVFSKANSQD